MVNDKKLSPEDQKIYDLCKKYGEQALDARRKFAGLLPEVFKRRIYQKKGFNSIFEFAAKLAGMSQDQVRLVLNLEKKFEDKPILKNMLINGETSVNKLARVAAVATAENQEFLADQLKLLPQAAIETLVRDIKFENRESEHQHSLQKPLFGSGTLAAATIYSGTSRQRRELHVENLRISGTLRAQTLQAQLKLKENIVSELFELQEKGIDINQLIKAALEKRRQEIAQEKEEIVLALEDRQKIVKTKKPSRYIPVKTRNVLIKEYGTKCSIQGCNKPSQQTHHSQKFTLSQFHDPHFMPRVCSDHHKIAHSIDIQFHEIRVQRSGT